MSLTILNILQFCMALNVTQSGCRPNFRLGFIRAGAKRANKVFRPWIVHTARVANLAYLTQNLAMFASFCDLELQIFCLCVFPNWAYFLASSRTSKISNFLTNISLVKLLF